MIELNDVLRVVAEWDTTGGTIFQLVWHYLVTLGTNDDPIDVLDDIKTQLTVAWANIEAHINDQVAGADIELLQYDFGNHQWDGVAADSLVGLDGTAVGEMLPPQSAVLLKFFTEKNRRQARKYVPGIIEGNQNSGVMAVNPLIDYALFAAALDKVIAAPIVTLTFGTFNLDSTSVLYETFSKAIQIVLAEGQTVNQRRRRPGTGI